MNDAASNSERALEAVHPPRVAEQYHDEPAEVSALARHADPSRHTRPSATPSSLEKRLLAAHARSQVAWVRPTELLPSMSARMIGRGIDLRADLTRRAQEHRFSTQATPVTRPGIRARARSLAPLSAFEHSPAHEQSVSHQPLRRL